MSTIKSSSEDLTLNADGSNEVKFQINAVEKASINSSGLFTSTTIDATKLTGNLPAISGASLTGVGGAWTFISSATASASATIEFTSGDAWADYRTIVFYVDSLVNATDAQNLWVRLSTDGGSTWENSSGDYEGGMVGVDHQSNETNLGLSGIDTALHLTASVQDFTRGWSGEFMIINPQGTASDRTCTWRGHYRTNATGFMGMTHGAGSDRNTHNVDGVQFLSSSGNLTSGTIFLYGIKDS